MNFAHYHLNLVPLNVTVFFSLHFFTKWIHFFDIFGIAYRVTCNSHCFSNCSRSFSILNWNPFASQSRNASSLNRFYWIQTPSWFSFSVNRLVDHKFNLPLISEIYLVKFGNFLEEITMNFNPLQTIFNYERFYFSMHLDNWI